MFPQQIGVILTRLEQAGFAAYAVGGCVRDTLLGRVPEDWDVTTAARPEQVSALFAGHCIPTGLRHGTVTVRQDGLSVEVTTFRADGPYSDHRRPDAVYFSDSLAEDLARRDLTVNAMAMDVRGDITDLYGGRDDLRRGILRCVGDPDKRFDEDALRIMRTLRFASVLGFTVEARTAAALHRCAPLLRDIAAERLLTEMDRLLCGAYVLPVLLAYPDVLGVFLPELLPCVGLDQRNRHHLYDVWEHTARSVAAIPSEPVLRWAMLLHDVGKPACFTVDGQGAAVDPQHLRHLLPGIGEPEVVAARLLPAVPEEQQDAPPQLRLCQIGQASPQLPELPGCLRQQISPQRDVTGAAPPAVGQDAVQRQEQHLRSIGGGHQRQRTGLSRRHQQVAEHAALFLPRRQCCCAVLAVLHRVHTAVQHDACHGYGIPGVP